MVSYYSLIVILSCSLYSGYYVEADPPCRTPNNDIGECMLIKECGALYAILQKKPITSADASFLRNSVCGFVGVIPKVCCPPTDLLLPTLPASTTKLFTSPPVTTEKTNGYPISSDLLPDKFTCGPDTSTRIYGGEKATLNEFPWMALIEYENKNGQRSFLCGGVLISKRYVLTASHCVKYKSLPRTLKPVSVRLGEYDTESDEDCISNGFITECSDPTVSIPVEEIIAHEQYDPAERMQFHDIALLRLAEDVKYTNFIKPICLPLEEEEQSKSYEGKRLTISGWGETENRSASNIKLKLQVPVKSEEDCIAIYNAVGVTLGEGQLCAGGEEGKDSCKGDSGGALMTTSTDKDGNMNWYAVGIVSFGPLPCAYQGFPAVYTKVSKYISWILGKLKP